jgi:hypothetical protein
VVEETRAKVTELEAQISTLTGNLADVKAG